MNIIISAVIVPFDLNIACCTFSKLIFSLARVLSKELPLIYRKYEVEDEDYK